MDIAIRALVTCAIACLVALDVLAGSPMTTISCAQSVRQDHVPYLSIFRLVAGDKTASGKELRTGGFMAFEADYLQLYPTSELRRLGEFHSAIVVQVPSCLGVDERLKLSEWDGKFVEVRGSYHAVAVSVSGAPGEIADANYFRARSE